MSPLISLEITLETRGCPLPRGAKGALLKAAQATIEAIPRGLPTSKRAKGRPARLALSCLRPAEMRRYNRQYRRKDRPTDVLSFSRLEGPAVPGPLDIGDVLLCPAVARKNAKEDGKPWLEELRLLTVHGVLHIFGYDHERGGAEARRMFRLQDEILSRVSGAGRSREPAATEKTKGRRPGATRSN